MYEFESPLWVVMVFVASFWISAYIGTYVAKYDYSSTRIKSVDGLRGYLALAVFVHHASVWFIYIKNGTWVPPLSNLYNQLGQAGVIMFFMVTGFLFSLKILNSKSVNWIEVYRSRLYRLFPVYAFSISIMVMLVLLDTNFILIDSSILFAKSLLKWYVFTIYGNPDLNGVVGTRYIVAGVPWSLPFEWMFYFCLPIISAITLRKTSKLGIFFSLIGLYLINKINPAAFYWVAFLCGGFGAFLFKMKINGKSKMFGWISIALMIFVLFGFETSYAVGIVLLMAPFFLTAASGNPLLRVLNKMPSIFLGELSYSIYLLHGIVLYVVFKYIVGYQVIELMTAAQYWALVLFITPFLLIFCCCVNRWIERPFINGEYKKFISGGGVK